MIFHERGPLPGEVSPEGKPPGIPTRFEAVAFMFLVNDVPLIPSTTAGVAGVSPGAPWYSYSDDDEDFAPPQ
jgi:hypothetical protein